MTIAQTILGLLEGEPRHGYELKARYDEYFPETRPLPFGQVYATLSRLHRDSYVDIAAVESGSGPERKLYEVTPAGVADLERWIEEPTPVPQVRSELLSRVVVALVTGRDPDLVLDQQRAVHLVRMRELTMRRRNADLHTRDGLRPRTIPPRS